MIVATCIGVWINRQTCRCIDPFLHTLRINLIAVTNKAITCRKRYLF